MSYSFTRSLMLIMIALSFYALANLKVPQWQDHGELLKGNVAAQIEDSYVEAFPLREFAINFWTAVGFLCFGEGEPGVVIGSNGWLYSSEEFIGDKDAEATYALNLNFIKHAQAKLKAAGVNLIVVTVPRKSAIYSEYHTESEDQFFLTLYRHFLDSLSGLEIENLDTQSTLLAAKSQAAVFLRTDTHWSPQGARFVAKEVAAMIGPIAENEYSLKRLEPTMHRGDLLNFLPLRPWFSDIAPADEVLSQFQITEDHVDLFAAVPAPKLALVGTSYSHDQRWQFADFLRYELQSDLVNFSKSGEGPFKPMSRLIENHLQDLPVGTTIIWEIPERYLVSKKFTALVGDKE